MLGKLKELASDALIYGLSTILIRFLSFLLTPLYSNYLSTSQFDFLIFVLAFTTSLSIFYTVGLESAYIRFFKSEHKENSKKAFTFAYCVINIISVVSTVLIAINSELIVSLSNYTHIENAQNLIIIASFIPLIDSLSNIPINYLRMSGGAIKLSIIKLLVILTTLGLHVYFIVLNGWQAEGAFWAQVCANSLSFVLLIPIIIKNFRIGMNKELWINMIRFAAPVIPAGLSSILIQTIDKPLLKIITGSEFAITAYQVNYRLAIPVLLFVSVFDFAWQPFYLKNYSDKNSPQLLGKVLTYFVLLSLLIFLIIVFFTEYVIRLPFFGGKLINPIYYEGLKVLPIVTVAYLLYGFYINFSVSVIVGKKTIATAIALMSALIVNVAMNFILVPEYSYMGSAYALVLTYLTAVLVIYFYGKNYFRVDYEWIRLIKLIIPVAIIYAFVFYISNLVEDMVMMAIIKFIGIIIFLLYLKVSNFFDFEELMTMKQYVRRLRIF